MIAYVECKTRRTALRRCPWACVIAKVAGGFAIFDSREAYQIWKRQK